MHKWNSCTYFQLIGLLSIVYMACAWNAYQRRRRRPCCAVVVVDILMLLADAKPNGMKHLQWVYPIRKKCLYFFFILLPIFEACLLCRYILYSSTEIRNPSISYETAHHLFSFHRQTHASIACNQLYWTQIKTLPVTFWNSHIFELFLNWSKLNFTSKRLYTRSCIHWVNESYTMLQYQNDQSNECRWLKILFTQHSLFYSSFKF